MDVLDDAGLFEAIQAGNAEAFQILYERYNKLVYTFALRACNDVELASEITQDVFVRLWTTTGRYHPERSRFTTWILTVTQRIVYDKLRAVKRKQMVIEMHGNVVEELLEPVRSGPEHTTFRRWFRSDVQLALQSLHAEERMVIELAYFRQLTLSEIAREMNRPLGTVKTRLHKALLVLREAVPEWKGGVEG